MFRRFVNKSVTSYFLFICIFFLINFRFNTTCFLIIKAAQHAILENGSSHSANLFGIQRRVYSKKRIKLSSKSLWCQRCIRSCLAWTFSIKWDDRSAMKRMNFCSFLYRVGMEVQKITDELQPERSTSSRTQCCSRKPALAYINMQVVLFLLLLFPLLIFSSFMTFHTVISPVLFLLFPFLFSSLKTEIDLLFVYFAYHIILVTCQCRLGSLHSCLSKF